MTVRDDRGREFATERAARIVSLVPSISETLWALGAGARLVGVTRYCTDPPELSSLPRCGGTKNPNCEAIIGLHPDLVFMSEEENRIEDFERLTRAGLTVFVSMPRTVDEVADWVRRVARAVGCDARGEMLALEIAASTAAVRARVARRDRRRRVLCPIWRKPWMTFNADTYAHDVLGVCGGDNVFADAPDRYCTITLEEAAARRPQMILLPDEPYPFAPQHVREFSSMLRPQGAAEGASVVDGQALSWYGARTPSALGIIETAIFGGHE